MAKVLLVGGPLDGQVRDLDGALLTRPVVQLSELTKLSDCVLPPSDAIPDAVTVRAHYYHVHKYEVCNQYSPAPCGTVYFAWHHDLSGPLEAMVMLMQAYQKEQGP